MIKSTFVCLASRAVEKSARGVFCLSDVGEGSVFCLSVRGVCCAESSRESR